MPVGLCVSVSLWQTQPAKEKSAQANDNFKADAVAIRL